MGNLVNEVYDSVFLGHSCSANAKDSHSRVVLSGLRPVARRIPFRRDINMCKSCYRYGAHVFKLEKIRDPQELCHKALTNLRSLLTLFGRIIASIFQD